jgi:hypothetical protein
MLLMRPAVRQPGRRRHDEETAPKPGHPQPAAGSMCLLGQLRQVGVSLAAAQDDLIRKSHNVL